MSTPSYVIITPARDEASHLERLFESIINQTFLPLRWIIVSDGSTDGTDQLAKKYEARHSFIRFMRRESKERNFASKVHAFNLGYAQARNLDCDFIGNQDADCSFPRDYYEKILAMFSTNPLLGIAGGVCHELIGGEWQSEYTDHNWSVAGGIQMFRRACYEQIGGYRPAKAGGIDTIAEIMARMHGWEVIANPELVVRHHRRIGRGKANICSVRYREGAQEFLLGYHFLFEAAKAVPRISEKPYVVGSFCRLAGYLRQWLSHAERCLPDEVVAYLRKEQLSRLRASFALKD